MKIKFGKEYVEVQVTRSDRKTWEMRMTPEGTLHVRGPLKTSEKKLLELVQTKTGWVLGKLEALRQNPPTAQAREFAAGTRYPYKGTEHPLHIVYDPRRSRASVQLEADGFRITVPEQDSKMIRSALEQWCRQQAKVILPDRLRVLEAKMGLRCNQITIKDQKKRWGSCSSRGNVNLNWRLVQMPPEVMDAVIIHELAHLVHPNHSAAYYHYLGQHNRDYKIHDRWLKERGKEFFA